MDQNEKGVYYAKNVKTKQAGVGTVYQSQDRQEKLQRSVSQVFAPMQAELSCNRDFLSKVRSKLGAKSAPDSLENKESEEPMQQHQPPNKRRLGRKETDKIAPNMPIIDRGAPYNGPKTKPAKGLLCRKSTHLGVF